MSGKRVNKEAIRAMAERLFVEEGLNAKSIAETLDVAQHTVGRWRKGIQGDVSWDQKRADYLAAPSNIKKVLMNELSELSKGKEPSLDVKAIANISKVIETISDKVNLQVVYSVFKEFDNWMASQDPDMAVQFLEWHKLFLLHKAQMEG